MEVRNHREFSRKQSPPWLLRHYGERFVGMFSLFCDLLAEGATRAVKASWLAAGPVPADALRLLGQERLMPRYPGESDPRYQLRLRGAWNAWRQPGTRAVLNSQLAALGYPSVQIVANYEWNWSDSGERDNWSRFWVYLPRAGNPAVNDDGAWGEADALGREAVWSDGGTWDSTVSVADARAHWSVIDQWKAAEEVCAAVVLLMEPGTFSSPTVYDGAAISLSRNLY